MREGLLKECENLIEHATYTAEAHHVLAVWERGWVKFSRVLPALVTAASGVLSVKYPDAAIWDWLTVFSAVTTAFLSASDLEKTYEANVEAAKGFTCFKHEVKALHLAFHPQFNDDELAVEVRKMLNKYNELVRDTPPTNEWSIKKAQRNIGLGRHDSLVV